MKSAVLSIGKAALADERVLIALGLAFPLLFYLILPALQIDVFGKIFSLNLLLVGIFLLVGGSFFMYLIYRGGPKYFVIPICVLFLYQTMYRTISLYLPFLNINFKTMVLLLISPVIIFVFVKYKFKPRLLMPYLPALFFFGMNVLYTMLGYMHAPNSTYNPEQYTHSANAIIPRSFGHELTVFLTFITIAIYIACNIFHFQKDKAINIFNKFLATFLLTTSVFCVGMYFLEDIRMINILAGVKRLAGLSSHTNVFAFFNACMILYLARIFYLKDENHSTKFKILCALAIIAGAIATLFTYSRSNCMLLCMMFAVNILLLSKDKMKALIGVSSLALIGFFGIFFLQTLGTIDIFDTIASRIGDDSSSDFRPKTWEYLYSQIQWDWRIFVGQGIGAISSVLFNYFSSRYYVNNEAIIYHPHNVYFQVFFDYGILGFLFYFGPLFYLLYFALKRIRLNNAFCINAIFLIELIMFALITSTVDAYLFNLEVIPFWIMVTSLYTQVIADHKIPVENT